MSDKPISPLRQRMIDDITACRVKEKVQTDYGIAAAWFPAPHRAHCWSSMNGPKKSESASNASSGSTFATCWSGRTTIIAPLARSMPRRSKISEAFLRSGV